MTNKPKFSLIVSVLLLASLACQTVVPSSATPTYYNPAAEVLDSANATSTAEAANAPARATEQAAQQAIEEATQSVQQTAEAFDAVAPDLHMLGYATMTVYANGTRLGSGTMTVNRTEGQIAFYTWQESGESTCTFSNAWIWELPPYSETEPADNSSGGDPSS